jgi:hypothetical protein
MSYLGNQPAANFASVTKDTFSGNGSTTAFTLSKTATTNGVAVYVENVRQIPTTAYTVSGTTLDFGSGNAPVSGTNNIYVLHHNAVASTANHPAAQALTATTGTFSAGVSGTTGTFSAGVSGTTGTFTGDVSIDGGSFVFNESGANKDFRVEGDSFANLLKIDASSDTIGIGIATPTFATGRGMHFTDDFHLGFGTGNGTRPDFQLGYDGTNTRLALKCGTGSDDTDIMITTGGQAVIGGSSVVSSSMLSVISGNDARVMTLESGGTGANDAILIKNGNGEVGTVRTSGSSTAYNTSSDYRLKENVNYSWDATTRLKQLKPARFNFKADADLTLDGFLAHEVSSVVPEAISGEKDATEKYTDEDGKEQTKNVYQGIDQSKLVPLLVKTIQELEARIAILESK